MGWSSSSEWQSKEEMVAYLVGPSMMGDHLKVVAHTTRNNTLWMVVECVKDTEHYKVGHRAILCILMQSYRGEGWGYKDMDEMMGPCDTSCPLKYFEMVPDPGSYATAWRAKVRAERAAKSVKGKIKVAVGMRIKLVAGVTVGGQAITEPVKVVQVKPIVCESEIGRFKVQPRHVAEVLPPAEAN